LTVLCPTILLSKEVWRKIETGIWYTKIEASSGSIHAVKIDPHLYRFGVALPSEMGRVSSTVRGLAIKSGAKVAINGGFFTPEYHPLGLIIDNGKVINPVKKMSWWGIFYISDLRPYIVHTSEFKGEAGIETAIQCGPRLVINGEIPRLKEGVAERSGVCIDKDGNVILVVTQNLMLSLQEFASVLKGGGEAGGLGCVNALNLDGGRSTQMYIKTRGLDLSIPGANEIADAIVVVPR